MARHPERLLERLSQPAAARLLADSGAAVIATGSVEQHGGHLPLGTDAFAALSVAERVAERLDTVVASTGLVGIAPYHLPWTGSLTLSPATLAAIVVDIWGGLRSAGAERIGVVNWHEGNSPTLRLAADAAQQQHGVQIVIAEAHVITSSQYPGEMEFTHAGAMETAAVLAYDADLVRLDDATEPSDHELGEAAHGLYRRPDVYPVLSDFRDIAPTGWYGHPAQAGRAPAGEIAEAVADHVVQRAGEIWAALASPAAPGKSATGDGAVTAAEAGVAQ